MPPLLKWELLGCRFPAGPAEHSKEEWLLGLECKINHLFFLYFEKIIAFVTGAALPTQGEVLEIQDLAVIEGKWSDNQVVNEMPYIFLNHTNVILSV